METNITAERIIAHLNAGGIVQVTTYLKSTIYTAKHAGMFSEGADGSLYVQHGRGRVKLSIGGRMLVGIRFGRIEE